MKLKTIKYILENPKMILYFLDKKRILTLPDKVFLKLMYKIRMNQDLNLDNPKTFNEKLQWLKLHYRNPEYTKMVDKYEAKKYVSNIIGKKHIIPTLGIYDKFDDINFKELPNQFVLKCTHDSGGIIIVKDKEKLNLKDVKKRIKKYMHRNYYYNNREWPYKDVKPRIIIEQYMEDSEEKELRDYKFFCFNGIVKFFKIDFDRFKSHKANYYDTEGKILPFGEKICPPDFTKKLKMPNNLKEMIFLAEKLAKDIKFVRIDFYEVNNSIYFGEITFYPATGMGKFIPEEWDLKLGNLLKLN